MAAKGSSVGAEGWTPNTDLSTKPKPNSNPNTNPNSVFRPRSESHPNSKPKLASIDLSDIVIF